MKQGLGPGLRSSASESLCLHDSGIEKGNWENSVELFSFDGCDEAHGETPRHKGFQTYRRISVTEK